MNRIGWGIAIVILLAAAAMAAMLRRPPPCCAPPVEAQSVASAGDTQRWVIPVKGVRPDQLVDSWHDPREGGARAHEALDIPAAVGTPVLAAGAGTVEKLFQSVRGGTTIYVRSTDGGWIAYYAHLSSYAAALHEGQRVAQGEPIGFVGDSGDAGAGNYHLHFALQQMRPGERWWQGTPVNPYPLLRGR